MTGAPRTQGGAAPPPPGVTPNLGDPADVLHTVNMVAQVFSMALVSVFVLLRTYAKAVLAPPFLLDDWACVVAWILSIGYSLTAVMMNHFGGGYHIWEISVEDHVGFLKSLYADTVIYGPNAYFTKVALLLVIARVFHTFTATRVVAHVFIGLMVGYYLPALLIKINVCRPIAAFWTPAAAAADGAAGAATCINQDGLFVADTVISAVTDFAVLALPIPATMSLRMSLRRRLRVWAMLGLGGVATLASIVRMVIVIRLRGATDTTVEFVRFNLLGTAEVSIGLICACLPALKILHTKWQQLRNASLTAASWETPGGGGGGGGAATPSKSPRMRSLKFLHGSRLHTQPPLSAIVAVVPGAARRSATATALLDVKRSAASCSGPPPSPPAARVGDGAVTV